MIRSTSCRAGLLGLIAAAASPAAANTEFSLTQERRPTSSPWEEPAVLTYSLDTRGRDSVNVQLNAGIAWQILPDPAAGRDRAIGIGTYGIYNRNTQSSARQNNVEFGIRTTVSRPIYVPGTPLTNTLTAGPPKRRWDAAFGADVGYARTRSYPDLEKAACVATPMQRQCESQTKESVRALGSTILTVPGSTGGRAVGNTFARYEFTPTADIAYDHLIDTLVDTSTNEVGKAGYLSIAPGARFGLYLGADEKLKLELSGQVRVRIAAGERRRDGLERAAEMTTASLTYYFVQPAEGQQSGSTDSGWRVGAGISFTTGADPLTGRPDQSIVLLALKIGRF